MEGGSQAQDHAEAIYAKIRYTVSSIFAIGCSKVSTLYSDTKVGTGSLCARVFRWFREVLPTVNSFAPFTKMASADGAKWMKDNLGT